MQPYQPNTTLTEMAMNEALQINLVSTSALDSYESYFKESINQVDIDARQRAGILLPLIPNAEDWEAFASMVANIWDGSKSRLLMYPHCLLIFYAGIAFYEYEENSFWPHFAKMLGAKAFDPNKQRDFNSIYSQVLHELGLKLVVRPTGSDFVGSAVHHIGIPLALWDGFLELCEWALWHENWRELSQEDWTKAVSNCVGGKERLKRFLFENREAAAVMINEMHDALGILREDKTVGISNLFKACKIRIEYFDSVPETAEFFRRIVDPQTLLQERARIIWNDQSSSILIQLPAVPKDQLPASWRMENFCQLASSVPDQFEIDASAFKPYLTLILDKQEFHESQKLCGIVPWGIFDLFAGGCLVNSNREEMPLRPYVIISQEKLSCVERIGFDIDEYPSNEPYELRDGSVCYITRLYPILPTAEIHIKSHGYESRIRFKDRSKIEARFFVGTNYRASYFTRFADKLKIENLPTLCLSIPKGYFSNNSEELNGRFKVMMDDRSARGEWESRPLHNKPQQEFFIWNWSAKPFSRIKPGSVCDISQIGSLIESPDLRGDHVLSIHSPQFEIEYKIFLDHQKHGTSECFKNLPGSFLPWFLLCQSVDGMTWDELVLAKDIIDPARMISSWIFRKALYEGLFIQKNGRWSIAESRAKISSTGKDSMLLHYCGDPSKLWQLFRMMTYFRTPLPVIQVIESKGNLPYLFMDWQSCFRKKIEQFLTRNGVVIVDELWSP